MSDTPLWRKSIPCACTILALCAGVVSILASVQGRFLLGAQLIFVSLILDGLDGTLARLLRGQSDFGGELDTFVDITSFGIAPAVLLYFHDGGLSSVPVWVSKGFDAAKGDWGWYEYGTASVSATGEVTLDLAITADSLMISIGKPSYLKTE